MNGEPVLYLSQHSLVIHARTVAELCQKLGYARGSARRMYVDRGAATLQVGYVVGCHWMTAYTPRERPA